MASQDVALVLMLFIYQVSAYGRGPSASSCFNQYPQHKTAPQSDPSPFVMTFDPPAYQPGQDVAIHVVDNSGADFTGFQIAARRQTGNPEEIVGRFVEFPTDKAKVFNCFGGHQNMVAHANGHSINNATFNWRAPTDNVGDVVFRSTFVQSYKTFWIGVEFPLPVNSTAPVSPAVYNGGDLKPQTNPINFDDCGDDKGCFFYPRACSGSDCTAAASFEYREATEDFVIELYANSDMGVQWVALGLSDDEWMGDDLTLSCTGGVGLMSVQEGINSMKRNKRLFNRFTSDYEVKHSNGKLQCRFVVAEIVSVYSIDQSVTDSFKFTDRDWNLKVDRYLFLAWGNTMPGSNLIAHHNEKPVVSSSKIDLTEKSITFTSTLHLMVQVHATLMIVAWMMFAGIVTVISRHYRDWMEKSTLCGNAIWFQIHRGLAIIVAALTVAGTIVIFIHFGTGIRDLSTPHSYVGLAVIVCVGLQLIAGVLRPGLDHSLRPFFNIGHRLMGHASHVLAAVTMFLAYEINYITKDMRSFGIIVLSVWVCLQIFWHVMFEIIKRYRAKTSAWDTYNIGTDNMKPDSKGEKNPQDCPHGTTLVTYILTLMGVCAAAILPLYTF